MAGDVLGSVGVVEVGYPIVPIRRLRATRVRPRHKGLATANLDLGLEGVGTVRVLVVRGSHVHEKDRHRPRARRNPGESVGTDRPLIHMERETAGVGNSQVAGSMLSGSRQRHRHRPFSRPGQPCRFGLPVGAFDSGVLVSPQRTITARASALASTRKLNPIDDGKKPFFAALRSSADSSASPLDDGVSSMSSSSSASALNSGFVPDGIRKPVRYQVDGRTQPGSRSAARV